MRRNSKMMAAITAAAVACSACSASADKAGGAPETVTLTFANPYAHFSYVPQVEAFVEAVERVSRGAIAIDVQDEWRGFAPGVEKGTIEDVAAGEVDLAWVGTRAFDLVDQTALQALTAPFLIDNPEMEQAVLDW